MNLGLIITIIAGLVALIAFGIWYINSKPRGGAIEIDRFARKSRARPPTPDELPVFYGFHALEEVIRLQQPGHRNPGLMFYYPSVAPGDKDFEMVVIGSDNPHWLLEKVQRAEYVRGFKGPGRDDNIAMMRWLGEVATLLHDHVAGLSPHEVESFELPNFFISALDFLMHHFSPNTVKERVMIALTFTVGHGGQHRGTHIVTQKVAPMINSFLAEWRAGARRRKITVGSMKAVDQQVSMPGQLATKN